MCAGLDAFGRVVDQLWMHGSVTSPTDRIQYGYDRDSNALYRKNVVNGNFSELYHANSSTTGDNATAYDNLNRLQNFRRGVLSASGNNGTGVLDTITTASATNNWNLDALGNWNSTGSQTRTFNSQNQITGVSGKTTPVYDNNGNTKTDERGYSFTYDAWNRMTISNGGIGHEDFFTYDADNRRPGISVCSGAVTDSYYSQDWQDLEDVAVTSGGCGGNTTETSTYVWSQSYVDDLVARDDSTYGRQYAQQDANHDVTALVSSAGAVQERFIYDPYGTSTILSSGWGNSSDAYNWVYRFQGGRFDAVSGLYNFRNRDYSPTLGRWMEQDPAGYVDGLNLYQSEDSDPANKTDPLGLAAGRCNCQSVEIAFLPEPLAWTAERDRQPVMVGQGKAAHPVKVEGWKVGWHIITTWTWKGDSKGVTLGYHEQGKLQTLNQHGDFQGVTFTDATGQYNSDAAIRNAPGFSGGAGSATLDDHAGTFFSDGWKGSMELKLIGYSVEAWCRGNQDKKALWSDKWSITGWVLIKHPAAGEPTLVTDEKPYAQLKATNLHGGGWR